MGDTIVKIPKSDFIFQAIKNEIRISHPNSGSTAECGEYKDEIKNQEVAFFRLIKTDKFSQWLKEKYEKSENKFLTIEYF